MTTEGATIPRVMARAADQFGPLNALEDGAVTLTYSELGSATQHAARAFIAAGIEAGDRVAIWAPNIWEWVSAAIGLQSVGAVLVPLSTRFKGSEAGFSLAKSRARILCTVGEFLGTDYVGLLLDALGGVGDGGGRRPIAELPDLERIVLLRDAASEGAEGAQASRAHSAGAVCWKEFLEAGDAIGDEEVEHRASAVRPEDLCDILFTSGTTGEPKGVMTTHGQTVRCFEAWCDIAGLREGDRYLVVNPFFHSFGYKAGWLASILRGATILPHAVFDVPSVLERIGRDQVSVLPGPPAIYQSILVHPERSKYDLSCLRMASTGAAVIPVELIRRMRDDLGFETVVTAYGLTESTGLATICRPNDDPEIIATTSGRAIPGVEVKCVGSDGKTLPAGEAGEILVRGFNVMQGYFENPEETAKTIEPDGWMHTADIGVLDVAGNLRITDRMKDMFIMGGFNCYPAEIEKLMHGWDAIAHVAVIGVPDARMGEVAMAFVVPVPSAQLDEAQVIAWCRENMSNYKVPRFVEIIDELPMNASGKVTKFVLRQRAKERVGA